MPTMPMRLPEEARTRIEVGLQPPHLFGPHHALARAHAPRRRQHQRHRHVGGVLGQYARRVGDGDAAMARGIEIDVIDAGAERGDQLEPRAGLAQHAAVDAVGDDRHQHVGCFTASTSCAPSAAVVGVQPGVEQLHQRRFDRIGQRAGDDHQRLLLRTRRTLARSAIPLVACPAAGLPPEGIESCVFTRACRLCSEMLYKGIQRESTVRSSLGGVSCSATFSLFLVAPGGSAYAADPPTSARARACRCHACVAAIGRGSMSAPDHGTR